MDLGVWIRALRAHFLTATVAPILVGSAYAYYETGSFDILYFTLALTGVAFIHLGANLANDYYDFRSGGDDVNVDGSEYSGGSRVIQEGLVKAEHIHYASLTFILLGALIGFYFVVSLSSIEVLAIGFTGVFLGYFYTATPFRLGYRGFAELANGLCFGPLAGLGAYYVQTQAISIEPVMVSAIPGLLLALLLVINEFPDYKADKHVGKKTVVVRLGRKKAVKVFHLGLGLAFIYILILSIAGITPYLSLIAYLSLPFALKAYSVSKMNYSKPAKLLEANKNTFLLHLIFNLLLAIGLAASKVVYGA